MTFRSGATKYGWRGENFTFITPNGLRAAKFAPKCTLQSFVFSPLLATGTPSSTIAVKYITPLKKCTALPYVVIIISLGGPGFELCVREEISRILFYIYRENEDVITKPQGERNHDTDGLGMMLSYIYSNCNKEITLSEAL